MNIDLAAGMFVVLAVALLAASILFLAAPILRRRDAAPSETGSNDVDGPASNAALLRMRLASIERDAAAGLMPPDQVEEARLEARRAAIKAEDARTVRSAGQGVAARWRFAAIAFLGLVPVATAAIYLTIGAPEFIASRDRAAASEQNAGPVAGAISNLSPEAQEAMISEMVGRLAARLEENPADADGWRRLARAYLVVGDAAKSAAASRRLLALVEGDADDWRTVVAALAASEPPGVFPVSDEFLAALDQLETRDPADLSVTFYRAGAAREKGEPERAARLWRDMLEKLPLDEPSRDIIEALIAGVENVQSVPLDTPQGNSSGD